MTQLKAGQATKHPQQSGGSAFSATIPTQHRAQAVALFSKTAPFVRSPHALLYNVRNRCINLLRWKPTEENAPVRETAKVILSAIDHHRNDGLALAFCASVLDQAAQGGNR